jgi:hypothetical protein
VAGAAAQNAAPTLTPEQRAAESKAKEQYLVRFVLYLGILGACIHAMTSVATYAGNQTFLRSWTTWYVLRPFIGGALAWLVFLVFRGGFLGGTGTAGLNPYAFGALGALSGLFSKQVTDKLSELIDTLFRMKAGEGDDARADKASPSTVSITDVQPNQLSQGVDKTTLTITGSGFSADSVVDVGGTSFKPTQSAATELKVEVPVEAYIGRTSVDVVIKSADSKSDLSERRSLKVVP